ncbi:MAG: crotonyl-CoA carboxylase/reductase, partial [Pseudomonadota bacterium]
MQKIILHLQGHKITNPAVFLLQYCVTVNIHCVTTAILHRGNQKVKEAIMALDTNGGIASYEAP